MAKARPYLIPFDGKDRLIEAGSLERARRHVINGELAKVRHEIEKKMGEGHCATSTEVIGFYRAGGTVEKEGEHPTAGGLLSKLTGGEEPGEEGGNGNS